MQENTDAFLTRVGTLTGIDDETLYYAEWYESVLEWLYDYKDDPASTLFWFGYNLAYGDTEVDFEDLGVFDQVFEDPIIGPYFLVHGKKTGRKFAIYIVEDSFRFKDMISVDVA